MWQMHSEMVIILTIYRADKKKGGYPFTRIINAAHQDKRLSWKARGLLGYMLSHNDDYKFYLDQLAEEAPDGIDSVKAGIKELEKFGYVKRYPTKVKGKIVAWNIDVYEKPEVDLPLVEKPLEENPTLITNNLITNNNNNYKDIKEKIYIVLPNDVPFINIYKRYFKYKFNRDHMKVTEENLEFILREIGKIKKSGIDESEWEDKVAEHFENLPEKNNGSIIPFLYASTRHFEVNYYQNW